MSEIIPAILAYSEEEFREKVGRVGSHAKTIQIDVMDGAFVSNKTWADAAVVAAMRLPYLLDVHLMTIAPVRYAEEWIAAGAGRIVVHAEVPGWREAISRIKAAGREAGAALNPDTDIGVVEKEKGELDLVLVMGVTPGWSGQEFLAATTEKVRSLRKRYPSLCIEVDGGVSEKTAKELVQAGADGLVAGSALFGAPNFEAAFLSLNRIANF